MVSRATLISSSGVEIPIALQRFVLDGLAENSKNSVIGSHAELTIRGYGVIQGGAQRLLLFGLHFPPLSQKVLTTRSVLGPKFAVRLQLEGLRNGRWHSRG